jgi:predicted dehydrogenase
LRDTDAAKLLIVADINLQAAESLAVEFNCRATTRWESVITLADVEAVVVATPPHLHAPISIAAMKAGKHVLCEKPLGRTLQEAEAIVHAARETGAKLKCGFNLRHHPGIALARRRLEEGQIGEALFLRCRYGIGGRPDYDNEWRAESQISGGGQLMDQGIHILDLCRWFLGDFAEAFAILATAFWDIEPLEDNAFVLLRTARGQIASLHVSWTQWKNLFSLEVFGRDGYIKVEGLGGSYGTERATLGRRNSSGPFCEEVVEFRGEDRSWHAEWEEFVAAIRESREPVGNGADSLAVHRLVRALYESGKTGRIVELGEG